MIKNDGKEYEEFVRKIQQSLINAENQSGANHIEITKNKKILDVFGIEREFDLYWEFSFGGHTYKTVIECKDYRSSISIEKIDSFVGKLHDLPDLKGIYATRTGYQRGAEIKADKHKIELLIVRETNDSDWVDEDGTSLIRTINLKMKAITAPSINGIGFDIDGQWFNSQNKYKEDELNSLFYRPVNQDVIIIDEKKDERYSLLELGAMLTKKIESISYGKGEYEESYENAYVEIKNRDVFIKIKKLKLSYEYRKPIEMESVMDFSQQILGIVENYHTGSKKTVYHNGIVMNR